MVMGKHEAELRQCTDCEFLRFSRPHWLPEAYGEAIVRMDTGLVLRNLVIARRLTCLLYEMFDRNATYLDTSGGTGLLVRLMRDVGFDFRWEDAYCENVHARGFEATGPGPYEVVTAFEAIEHMEHPAAFVAQAVARSPGRTLIFTTELFEGGAPPLDWWYYAFEGGQHISFFSARTLERMAQRLSLRFYSSHGIHIFTAKELSPGGLRQLMKKSEKGLYEKIVAKMSSLTMPDHRLMAAKAAAARPVH